MQASKKVCVFTIHPTKDLRVLNRQCRSLQRNGWDVTLIAIANKKLNADAIIGKYDNDGITVIGVEKWKSLKGRISTLFRIVKLAGQVDADIYHFHDPDLLVPALLLKIKKRKPIVYDIHEHFNIIFPFKFPDIWPMRQLIGMMVLFAETFLGIMFRNISLVYEEHQKRFSWAGCKIVHTPNFASLVDFQPIEISEKQWYDRVKKVLFIGSLSSERGALLIPQIAKLVRDKHPEVEFIVTKRFHNAAQEKEMLEFLSKPEYKDVITFIENVNGNELPSVVRKAGIALSVDQPTKIGLTSQPTKTFEYMSQGLAIVASALPNTIEYVKGVGCGVVVDPKDPQAYADQIISLVENPQKTIEMGKIGQKAFIEKYNWSVVEKRLVRFYEEILKC